MKNRAFLKKGVVVAIRFELDGQNVNTIESIFEEHGKLPLWET